MKRRKLCKMIEGGGRVARCEEGGRHTKYYAEDGRHCAVPRHREVAGGTAAAIIKRCRQIGLLTLIIAVLWTAVQVGL